MNRYASFFYWLILPIFFFFGCSKDDHNEWQLAPDEYVFVEAFYHRHTKIIEDNSQGKTLNTFCCPEYSFNPSAGTLEGEIDFPILQDLVAIIGWGYMDDGDVVGNHVRSSLRGHYLLPINQGTYKLEDVIDGGGTLFTAFDEEFVLMPGEEKWFLQSIDTLSFFFGELVAEVKISYFIKNHGVLRKNNITKR